MQLTSETYEDGDTVVVMLWDEVDCNNAAELAREVNSRIRKGGKVALDLGRLRFIDSSGIRVLIRCRRMAEDLNCEISLRLPPETSPFVLKVLSLSGLLTSFATTQRDRRFDLLLAGSN
ncbi:MAG: putative anti-sigma factor antagonist BtrV [bacterium ADurb.Bin400]|nr:MAG: putative anti-sigma factor antagonist BtrV [bacterium ADurb.Bin400]